MYSKYDRICCFENLLTDDFRSGFSIFSRAVTERRTNAKLCRPGSRILIDLQRRNQHDKRLVEGTTIYIYIYVDICQQQAFN
jgi:hypothetical protein